MLLALETATASASIALLDRAGAQLGYARLPGTRDHGRSLAAAVQGALDGRLQDVEAYALSIGPGSFTGLRVGLAFLKGLALGHPRPVFPVSTLRALAAGLCSGPSVRPLVLSALDARAEEVYAALWRAEDGQPVADPRLPEGLYATAALIERLRGIPAEQLVAAGDGVSVLGTERPAAWEIADAGLWCPDARAVGRLALRDRSQGACGADPLAIEPAYHQRAAVDRRNASNLSNGAGATGQGSEQAPLTE